MIIRVSGSTPGSSINLNVTGNGVPGSAGITVNVPQFVSQANSAITSSYAATASFAFVTLGSIESASHAKYAEVAGVAQSGTGSFSGTFIGNGADLFGVVTSSFAATASAINFVPLSASFANTDWNNINNRPSNLVSSSVQAASWSVQFASSSVSATLSEHALTASLAQQAISSSYFLVSSSCFVPGAEDSTQAGTIYFSSARDTLSYQNVTNSTIDVGFTLFVRVYNATGVSIPKGTVLEYDGVFASGRIRVKPAIAPNMSQDHPIIIGLAHEAISAGNFGNALNQGVLYNTNTAGLTEGNQLYLSTTTSGSFTEVAPSNNFHRISIGTNVITQPSTGRILVSLEQYCPPNWNRLVNKPDGLVSSSIQAGSWTVATASVATSASFAVSASWAPNVGGGSGLFASSSVSASWASQSLSSSFAVSASWAPTAAPVDWNTLAGKPTGLVSSSAQITAGLPAGTVSSSAQVNAILDADGVFSSSAQVQYSGITGVPVGILSSSAQINLLTNVSASWASRSISSSFAPTDWNAINNRPVGIYSSSAQLPVGLVSASSQINYAGIFNIPVGIVSSSAQAASWTVATASVATSASFATTASYAISALSASWAPGVGESTLWSSIVGIPVGLVSSSAQINTGSFNGSFTGGLNGSASFAGTDWNVINNRPVGLFSSSAQLPVGVVSASSQISYAGLSNVPVGIVSSSTQATTWTVATASIATSASFATTASAINFVPVSASFAATDWSVINNRPIGLISSSAQVIAGLPVGSVSASSQINYTAISNIPVGIVSSSTQINAVLDADGVFSSSAQVQFAGITGTPVGILSSSAQINLLSSVSASWASRSLTTTSASFASDAFVVWTNVSARPVGLVSSSAQINTGSFTGSFTGTVTNAVSATYAGTDWNAVNNKPIGIVSASNQVSYTGLTNIPVGIVSSSTQITFGSIAGVPTGIVSSSAQATTWTVATSSIATSASYALSASYVPGGGGAPFNLGIARTGSLAGSNISVVNFLGGGIQGITISGATASIEVAAGAATSASYALTASFATSASWAPGGSSAPAVRTTTVMSTSVLTQNAFETGTVSLARGFVVYRIITSVPARVRLYMTTRARDVDRTRGTNVEPTGSHEIIVDVFTTTNSLTASLAPIPYGAVLDEPLTTNVPYTITNLQTGSVVVSASFTFLPLE